MEPQILEKLTLLAEGAKYDVSCSSSGVGRRNQGGLGSASSAGICHSWSRDGRCISLLKVLLSNRCVYDCAYCVNRRSNSIPRTAFEPRELAELTFSFYRRNYIEGLFLSSAVDGSPDQTAERMVESLRLLRREYSFGGYIHTKIIPGTDPVLVHQLGLLADRLSINLEVPSPEGLARLAPQKKPSAIFSPMRQITGTLMEQRSLSGPGTMFKNKPASPLAPLGGVDSFFLPEEEGEKVNLPSLTRKEPFAPAGQTTQMMVGASGESDQQILLTSEKLYHTFLVKRVYFSAYVPLVDSPILPSLYSKPPLAREHRLYQADWLLRFYGFAASELFTDKETNLDPELDPKITWALRNIHHFPMEINKVSFEELLRIPGIGVQSALRIVNQRKVSHVQYDDLKRIGVVLKRARFFLTCNGKYYGGRDVIPEYIRAQELKTAQGLLKEDKIRERLIPPEDPQISWLQDSASGLLPHSLFPELSGGVQ